MFTLFQITDAKNRNPYYVSNGLRHRAITDNAGLDCLKVMMLAAGLEWKVEQCTKAQLSWAGIYDGVAGTPAAAGAVNPYL